MKFSILILFFLNPFAHAQVPADPQNLPELNSIDSSVRAEKRRLYFENIQSKLTRLENVVRTLTIADINVAGNIPKHNPKAELEKIKANLELNISNFNAYIWKARIGGSGSAALALWKFVRLMRANSGGQAAFRGTLFGLGATLSWFGFSSAKIASSDIERAEKLLETTNKLIAECNK